MLRKRQQKIYRYAFWLALCVTLLVAFILLYFGYRVESPYKEQFYSISTNLLSSIIFAIIFTFLANKELLNLLKDEINESRTLIVESVVNDVNHHFAAYNPSGTYLPTAGIDTVFNADITSDLKVSAFYFFRGVSAKYVAVRAISSSRSLGILKVMILDPKDNRSITLRARDRSLNPKYSNKSMNELIEGIRHELYMSIVSLYDCRYLAPVEIAYGVGTSVLRLEIFDEAMYMSLYHTSKSVPLNFPETIRYKKQSVLYDMFRMDSFREFELSENRIKFDNSTNESVLLNHLADMGMSNVSIAAVNDFRDEYAKFSDDFIRKSKINS
jgi:hypothetical protein